jgi:hypothetical protein
MLNSEWEEMYGSPPPTREGTGLFSLTYCGGCGCELIDGLDPETDFILCDDCEPILNLYFEEGKMWTEWKSKSAWSWNCLTEHLATQVCSDCIRRWISNTPDVPSYRHERSHAEGPDRLG